SQPAGAQDDTANPMITPDVRLPRPKRASTGPALREDLVVRMPLQDIIQRSVMYSREVQVAGYDPAIAKTRILEALARFDPTPYLNAKVDRLDTQVLFSGIERGDVYTAEAGIKQLLPSGGQVQLSYQTQYNDIILNPASSVGNIGRQNADYWDDQLKLQLTQPLLRNFGTEINQARITIAQNDQQVSVLDFRKALEENIAELEKDYWQSQEAEQEVIIQERLLRQTEATRNILVKQSERGGAVSRVQTSQAIASVETRGAVLIRARARLRDISYDIKRRMNDPNFPVAGPAVIMPYDQPTEVKLEFLVKDQIDAAVLNRFELGQQQLRINDAAIAQRVALNNTQPKLDLVGSIGLEGIAENNGIALSNQFIDRGQLAWSVGFQFELPLGNREARAIFRRSQIQRLQAITQYANLVDQVALDVLTAINEIDTTWNEIGSRRYARFAQADELLALEQRQKNGEPLTPTFVQLLLDAQSQLADAQREEALAIASYQVAIARLERAKGTLLRYNNVVLAEGQFRGMNR
ncbi:MAG TPA: TolC family protein, partial [Tepidisphaeraceae bacterium]|nr:TolC family protein [Tepidisphaeraceae bacterium]